MTPGLDPTASRGLSPQPLAVDLHMHTTTSDGHAPLADMIAQAERLDLSGMGVSDHVRSDTDWVPEYVRAVRSARRRAALPVRCGVEAKILDTRGRLDLPHALAGVDCSSPTTGCLLSTARCIRPTCGPPSTGVSFRRRRLWTR